MSRFVECTLNTEKISESKRKLKLINYTAEFCYGSIVPAFFVDEQASTKVFLKGYSTGEINPLFKMIIKSSEIKKMVSFFNEICLIIF